ncbi:MAG TPA: polyprenyl diphosphate synthase, partial [Thermodesulfobacteriota bacterium]|nr:polyprenyl diphosphate synthase [Thermodesulfobacteriota bacterium]
MNRLDKEKLPRHVAVIMDGNGRWAARHSLHRVAGHQKGAESVREVVRASREIGIPYLTLFAFSSENWSRPRREVDALMVLLNDYLESELGEMRDNDIRLMAIGDLDRLPTFVLETLGKNMKETAHCTGMTLSLALSYGGRDDILHAVRAIARHVRSGNLPGEIDENVFCKYLWTAGLPDPDLLIRTSGEMRISNFFLWQLAYTEMYVTSTLWPD